MSGSKILHTGLRKSKTFCSLPWISITTDPDGSVRPCCISLDKIKKPDGREYNLGYDNILDIINSQDMVSIRDKMLSGETVKGCQNCYKQEESSGISQRTFYNQIYKGKFNTSTVPLQVKYIDLRFGNLCNLKCRSCNNSSSSSIGKEIKELLPINLNGFHYSNYGLEIKIDEWYKSDIFFENIEKIIGSLDTIYMTGGEPTLVENNIEFLDFLVQSNRSADIRLKINSNLTNLNKDFYYLIKKFKSVCFFASLDGYDEVQEYLRYPSNWKAIHNNIQSILSNTNMTIRPTPVIQIGNLNKITELFEYFESYNRASKHSRIQIDPIILEFPDYFSIKYLPNEYKVKCFQQINDWIKNKCKYQNTHFHKKIESIKYKCATNDFDKTKLLEYKKFNDILDTHREHYLKNVNPELSNLLETL